MKLTKNFSLDELTQSNTATRLGINNEPDEQTIQNLKLLCEHILQPLRDAIGTPIRITSGFRSLQLNTKIGGSKTSDHMKGFAGDIKNPTGDNMLLFKLIIELNLPFKQLIYEFGNDLQPQWIHVAVDENIDNPKREILKAIKKNGRTIYIKYSII